MDAELRKGLSEARQLVASGEITKGLSKFAHLIDLWPNIFTLRLELAEVLVSLRWKRQAAEIFEAAARYFCQAGFPLMAIYTLKRLGDVEPDLIDSPLQMLISTYEYGSKKTGNYQITDYPSFSSDYAREIESLAGGEGEWIALLTRMATDIKDIKNYPKNLPVIPILSSLNQENFVTVLDLIDVRHLHHGEHVFHEGEAIDSMYLLANGKVRMYKKSKERGISDLEMAYPGAVIGEIAFMTGTTRFASAQVVDHAYLISLSLDAVERLVEINDGIIRLLMEFAYNRLLRYVLDTSILLRPLGIRERARLLKVFCSHFVHPGQTFIVEGMEGQGLFVILSGRAAVWKEDQGRKRLIDLLEEGDVVGEISLIKGIKTTANVTAITNLDLLYIDKQTFEKVCHWFPAILNQVNNLVELRMSNTASRMKMEFTENMLWDEKVSPILERSWAYKRFNIEELILDDLLGPVESEVILDTL